MPKKQEEVHKTQMLIMKQLLFKPNSKFTDINTVGLSSDHFSYHVNSLVEQGLIVKNQGLYSLTPKGKEFANTMDTDEVVVEKQPKIAVMVIVTRHVDGEKQLLIQERRKEPYFGYHGFITGKVRFGETIKETAIRELKEETGLDAANVEIKSVIHDHVYLENQTLVEDKIFFVASIKSPTGELINTDGGKNYWLPEKDFHTLSPKFYNEDEVYRASVREENLSLDEGSFTVNEF